MSSQSKKYLGDIQDEAIKFLASSSLSSYQICKDTGISEVSIGNYRKGIKRPNFANAKILAAYFEDSTEKPKTDIIAHASNTETPNNSGLPLIPFDCVAGYGEDNEGVLLPDCTRYKIPEFESLGAEFYVRVSGSSMYPKYSSGDILGCRKIKEILFFQWGKIYVIDSSQGQLIKRIFEHEDPDKVTLVSDNKEKYHSFAIPKSDIRSLSIVVGAVRPE